jgi:precorrin-2/cobalt-factor-2 C20-methyltransferase
MRTGTLFGVGIGPGDPELITVKGLRLLRAARTVFVPATAPGRSYARTIAERYLEPARQPVEELVCPPFRERGALLARWRELAGTVAAALVHGDAVFLTEGDPSLHSTFQYLRFGLAQDYPEAAIVTVPGVTSASAAAAAAGIPLAMWDERLALLPGTAPAAALRTALDSFETVVVLKPRAALPLLQEAAGYREVMLAQRVGRPEELILRGAEALDQAAEDYFSLVIVRGGRG